jgi:hypothetical protein
MMIIYIAMIMIYIAMIMMMMSITTCCLGESENNNERGTERIDTIEGAAPSKAIMASTADHDQQCLHSYYYCC